MPRLSSPYLRIARINELLDVAGDREHPVKRSRAAASAVHVPDLYELFNGEPARSVPLWMVGEPAAGQRP